MKKIELPVVDDLSILDIITGRNPLRSCPHLQDDLETVRTSYEAYGECEGNPFHDSAPAPAVLNGSLAEALKNRYTSHSDELSFIEEIRNADDLIVCPMCGASHIRSVDHIFPQSLYAEFAIYSKNLVPACMACNTKRQNAFKGANPGERVLHPYFDVRLDERLVRASFEEVEGSYRRPIIDVVPNVGLADALCNAIQFHIDNVIKRAGIISELDKLWIKLQQIPKQDVVPHVYFQQLPMGNFTDAQFYDAIYAALTSSDEESESLNSWKSIMYAGLLAEKPPRDYLAGSIRDLRRHPDRAQEV
jgi:hypothetical protein